MLIKIKTKMLLIINRINNKEHKSNLCSQCCLAVCMCQYFTFSWSKGCWSALCLVSISLSISNFLSARTLCSSCFPTPVPPSARCFISSVLSVWQVPISSPFCELAANSGISSGTQPTISEAVVTISIYTLGNQFNILLVLLSVYTTVQSLKLGFVNWLYEKSSQTF